MKNNWLKYLVAIALLINAVTLIFFWYNRPPEDGKRASRQGAVLIETLKLDEKQQAVFHSLREEHHQTHDSLLQIIAAQRQLLYGQKQAANDSIITNIGRVQADIERVTYDHFKEVRKICTPEQQAQLDVLLEKTVQNILMPRKKGRRRENEH